ncbi:MAG: hypothetical protein Tsb0027_11400 [Wenzhouxiangellaceae bacterium]
MFRSASYDHAEQRPDAARDHDDLAILLANLGTPAAATPAAVRPYLKEFLWDRRVVEAPRVLWWLILHGIVLPFRSKRSARAYSSIWMPQGSPLLHYSERLAQQMQTEMSARFPGCTVALAMTYGQPAISAALEQLRQQGKHRLLLVPLYPQYSATTTAAVFDAVTRQLQSFRWLPELRVVNQYYQHDEWQQAVAESIRGYRQQNGSAEVLLFSFHGIPKQYFQSGDPYFCQCQASARRIASLLQLDDSQWRVSFQSRLGRDPWLQPYTDHTLEALAADGIRTVQVVCPGFATDCLETLEEIAMENAELFVDSGGETLDYIPALNDDPLHVQALSSILTRHVQDWPGLQVGGGGDRLQRAQQLAEAFNYRQPPVASAHSDTASTGQTSPESAATAAAAAQPVRHQARKTSHG